MPTTINEPELSAEEAMLRLREAICQHPEAEWLLDVVGKMAGDATFAEVVRLGKERRQNDDLADEPHP